MLNKSIIKVSYSQSSDIFEFKINFLIVAKQAYDQNTLLNIQSQKAFFQYDAKTVDKYNFTLNFGINSTLFGVGTSNMLCFYGITSLTLTCPQDKCLSNAFYFALNRSTLGSLSENSIENLRMEISCLGFGMDCPVGTFYNSSSRSCQPCKNGC